MQDLSTRFADLSPAKRQLLLKRLAQQSQKPAGGIPPRPASADQALPLSFAQERMWLLDQWLERSPVYNMAGIIRFTGPLVVAALEQSLDEVIRRHEILRTTFVVVDSQPVQQIAEPQPFRLELIDLGGLEPAAAAAEVQRRAEAEARAPFDLASGPLLRASMLRLSASEHALLMTLHHSVADGWSTLVLFKEMSALYEAFVRGQASPLPPLPIQYADYALWQRETFTEEALAGQIDFWRGQLGSEETVLDLPVDFARPSRRSFNGARHSLVLTPALTQALRGLSQRAGTTLFMTLLAAFDTLLFRYTQQEQIAVGTPISGRVQPELQDMVGCFLNTLVMRVELEPGMPFSELLQRVRTIALDAYAHQDVPFEQLVKLLRPQRTGDHSPLFQVAFSMESDPNNAVDLPSGVRLQFEELNTGTAKFDLTLEINEGAEALSGWLDYNADLFAPETIARLAGCFTVLLEGIVAAPDTPLAGLPLLTAAQIQQQLVEWNATATSYPRDTPLAALFEQQVAHTPAAVALCFDGVELSYAELNRRANQLAHCLQGLGVGPDMGVGIFMEPSLDFIVSTVAILKAGGAYVPLDPSYPFERLAFMLEDAGVTVLLTQEHLLARLGNPAVIALAVDAEAERLAEQPSSNPTSAASAGSRAYIMYTSGSTGRPKGISIPQRAISRLVRDTNYVRLGPDERFGQVSNISFDAATFEIWGALLNGGRLVGIPKDVLIEPALFAAALREHRITTMFLTAALFNRTVRERPDAFATMRTLMVGGEALDPDSIRAALTAGPPERLLNGYGPTESTTFAAWYHVALVEPRATSIPIGYPLANTQLYVLDPWLQPVPVGVRGELYIGGDGLAHGYVNRPDLNEERFVPNPFGVVGARDGGLGAGEDSLASSPKPQASRLYRTGDIVRQLPDGAVDYVGRNDDQVKIRGFRIELGEIEALLTQHPEITAAAVVVREDTPGDKRLVAYLTANTTPAPAMGELRRWLRSRLPDYMLPSAFVALESLPLTANGKMDRRVLPAPEQSAGAPSGALVAPETPTEASVLAIWAQVLQVAAVSVEDNFFECGGHSLVATQIVSRICETFNIDFSLRLFFENPTIRASAALIDQQASNPDSTAGTRIEAQPRATGEVATMLDELDALFLDVTGFSAF